MDIAIIVQHVFLVKRKNRGVGAILYEREIKLNLKIKGKPPRNLLKLPHLILTFA